MEQRGQKVGADFADGDDETVITVTWGPQKLAPIQYHNFDVGPFAMVVRVKRGESIEQAFDRAWRFLDAQAKRVFPELLKQHLTMCEQAGDAANRGRRRA